MKVKTTICTFLIFFKTNILKIFVIFFVGFFSRLIVNYYSDINVFTDFTSMISIIYYLKMSCIIVYLNNLDLQFTGLKHDLAGITYDHFINVIKFMINSDDLKKMSMNWEGYSLNNKNVTKTGNVMFMNNPQGGNQPAGWRDPSEGCEEEYKGPSRYIGGEPMDIPVLSEGDRRRLLIYLVNVRDGEDGLTRLNKTGTPTLSHILNEIERKSGAEISYGISKQICKFMWTCEERLEFQGKISSNGKVTWSRIGAGPDSQIMIALRGGYSGGGTY